MPGSRTLGLIVAAPLVLLTACSTANTPASSPALGPATTFAPGAGALRAAARTMAGAPSYRFVAAITTGGVTTHVTGEFQAPDRIHETIVSATGAPVEAVFADGQVMVRNATSGQWSRPQQPAGQSPAQDPREAFSLLAGAGHVAATGTAYRFTLPAGVAAELVQTPGGPGGAVAGLAVISPSGISHLEFDVTGRARPVRVVLDYTDIGQGPPVTQPS